jgi:hypothetical protein
MPQAWCADEEHDFNEWQGKYLSFLKQNAKPISESYQRRLSDMEKAAVAKRHYALAAKLKAARESAARDVEPGMSTAAASDAQSAQIEPDGSVTLRAPAATMAGGVAFETGKNALVSWKSDQAAARWKLPVGLKTGGYEVELTYACGSGGAAFTIKEDVFSLQRQTKDTGSWMNYKAVNCGVLRVKSTSQYFQLSANVTLPDGLFYLRQVRLIPCAAL